MLLSIQQRFIWETLKRLGCVRRDQLHILTREKFRRDDLIISEARMDAMLRQLRNGMGELRLEGELVKLSAAAPEPRRLEAIDVMLELTGGAPLDFEARRDSPLLLQFTWASEANTVRPFTVALLSALERPGDGLMERHRRSRVIWISNSGDPPNGLALPPKHFFAARTADGSHRFYTNS